MRQIACTAFSASNVSSSNGAKIDTRQLYNASFQVVNNDTDLAGSMKLQFSNDNPPNGAMVASFTPTHWSDIPSATVTFVAGVPSVPVIPLVNMAYTWVRCVLTQTTPGTTTTQVLMNAQGF